MFDISQPSISKHLRKLD
ncbi:hypothetical protein [Aeribacillus pallidus]|nr:hypothetical protein EW027_03810 [Aeribacillus pallidus]